MSFQSVRTPPKRYRPKFTRSQLQNMRPYRAPPKVARLVGTGEMKYFDTEYDATAITACGATWAAGTLANPTRTINLGDASVATPGTLFAPKVSASLNGRIGRKTYVHKIKVTGGIIVPTQTGQFGVDTATRIRIILVQDKQSNAASMTAAQLMNGSTTAVNTISSYQNPDNFGRFKVLKEKWFTLADPNIIGDFSTGSLIQSSLVRNWKLSYTFKTPVQVDFNATNGGTIADVVDNSFHILIACDNTALAPTANYYSRVTYKE